MPRGDRQGADEPAGAGGITPANPLAPTASPVKLRSRVRDVLVRYPRAVPSAILIAILAITGISVFAIEKGEAQRDRAAMTEAAQVIAVSLESIGETSAANLRAGSALLASNEEVDPELLRDFVMQLSVDESFGGAEGIGWAEALRFGDVQDFESRIAKSSATSIAIEPAPTAASDRIVPVTFLEPETERARRALGFDMYSEPVRRAAMDQAEQLVRPTASGKVVLVQEGGGDTPGFLIYMPVFGNTDRGRELRGFIYSPFNAREFLRTALDGTRQKPIGIALFDGRASTDNLLAERPLAEEGDTRLIKETVVIANRAFELRVTWVAESALSPLSMATLLFGLAVASLLMMLARLLTQQAIEDENSLRRLSQEASIRDSLTRELNHRVKNTLANVLSIISLTRRRTANLDEFADGLEGRIRAISATHALLTQSEWGTTPLGSVVEVEVAPYSGLHADAVTLEGPQIDLAPNDALSLGLAIHELSTNAAKFGALSTQEGRVHVRWKLEGADLAIVEWVERDGPLVSPLRQPGFGTDLLEKIVAHELRHPVDLVFEEYGVRCTLRVPVRHREEFRLRSANGA